MRKAMAIWLSILVMGCTSLPGQMAAAPKLTWGPAEYTFFPVEGGLTHAEDGVVLPDGRLLVGDYEHGLVTLDASGERTPFSNFAAAGYEAAPSAMRGGPNGVSWDTDGRHVLVADIFTGSIYRADTVTDAVTQIYDHPFGINSVVRDSTGAIWFTQSTRNPSGAQAEARMFAAAFTSMGDGTVYRIAADQVGREDAVAEPMIENIDFANGIVVDEERGQIYVSELVQSRVLAAPVDFASGEVGTVHTLASVPTPDNLELDEQGMVWAASPVANAIFVINPGTGHVTTAFNPHPETSARMSAEWSRRVAAGENTQDLLVPALWGTMPGLITGVILTPGDGPVYLTNLGGALIRLDR